MHIGNLFSSGRGSFLALAAASTQGGRVYTMPHIWDPGGLRGACSERSKSRRAGSSRGIVFRPAKAKQVQGNPTLSFFSYFHLRYCFGSTTAGLKGYSKHHSTTAARQDFPIVAATNVAYAFGRACVQVIP